MPPGAPATTPPCDLSLTGERTLPGVPDEQYWFARHIVAYRLAAAKARDRRVLDAGSGEGYGAALMAAAGASLVTAVDLDAATVAHVARTYPEIGAVRAELGRLPLADGSIDLVASLQVMEHVWDVPAFLGSLHRVLAPGGELVLSTPNRLTFTPDSDEPVNPFHVREFTAGELRRELEAAGFTVGTVLGLHHGPVLATVDRVLRQTMPHVLSESAPDEWPAGVRRIVHRTQPSWFRLSTERVDESLDLIALCRRPAPSYPPDATAGARREEPA